MAETVLTDPLDQAELWLRAGKKVVLATVIETWGSAPRQIGSHLAMTEGGDFMGSVSGGCVEGDVISEAEALLESPGCKVLQYGVADETAWQVGLSCGGRIKILLESIY